MSRAKKLNLVLCIFGWMSISSSAWGQQHDSRPALSAGTQDQEEARFEPPRVFCMSREGLQEARRGIARNDPLLRAAYLRLLDQADRAFDVGPFSVMLKSKVPPSGDKHDYMSVAPYAWPNPDTDDGLPYVTRDGCTNPEWWQDGDRVPLQLTAG
jgi:hypothetical protein